jgi:hypothetical protein
VPHELAKCGGNSAHLAQSRPWGIRGFFVVKNREKRVKLFYLGVQQVPGQGTFHTYRDGSWFPAEVDGEVVHPVWG